MKSGEKTFSGVEGPYDLHIIHGSTQLPCLQVYTYSGSEVPEENKEEGDERKRKWVPKELQSTFVVLKLIRL